MRSTSKFADKLSTLLFLCVKEDTIKKIFGVTVEREVYLPVPAERVTNNIKNGNDSEKVPVNFFIEGMFYVLGADENFKYNSSYMKILNTSPSFASYIKGLIYELINDKKYLDAYLTTKGLSFVDDSTDVINKLFLLADYLRESNDDFEDEEIALIDKYKERNNYPLPYLYEAIIKREKGDFEGALFCINSYFAIGGESTPDALELKVNLKIEADYKKGRELATEAPKEALELLLPLLDEIREDAVILYYIGVAYRALDNHEKAIFYLNEALMIDDAMPEVVNELGINWACLGDYENAVIYLRKAFEATKAIEICTNIVLCYINLKDLQQAKLHLDIARKIDPNDEIVKQLEELTGREN